MGMYTELVFRADLDPSRMTEADRRAVDLLFRSERYAAPSREQLPLHSLFDCPRWHSLFNCDSAAHPGCATRSIEVAPTYIRVAGKCSLNNHGREVEEFLAWVGPFVEPKRGGATHGQLLGWIRHEEDTEYTFLYAAGDGCITLSTGTAHAQESRLTLTQGVPSVSETPATTVTNHIIFTGPPEGLGIVEYCLRARRIERTATSSPIVLRVDSATTERVTIERAGHCLFVRCRTEHGPLGEFIQAIADMARVRALNFPSCPSRRLPVVLYRPGHRDTPVGMIGHPLTVEEASTVADGLADAHWLLAVLEFHARIGFEEPIVSVESILSVEQPVAPPPAPSTETTILYAGGIRFTGGPRNFTSDIQFGDGNPLELYRRDQPGEPERWLAATAGLVDGAEVEGAGVGPDEAVFEFRCALHRALRKALADRDRAARIANTLAKGLKQMPPLDEAALLKAVGQ